MHDTMQDATHTLLDTRWKEAGEKVVALADDFPEHAYPSRPAEGMWSFAEQLRHLAFWNDFAARTLCGESPNGAANTLDPQRFSTKGAIVHALRLSFDDVRKAFASRNGSASSSDIDTMVSYLAHASEHYGQLVAYCRAQGIVPPASR